MLKLASAFIAGVLVTLSLAPFNYSVLVIAATGILFTTLRQAELRSTFTLAFSYSFGLFLSGASWVYVSIHEFGYLPPPLAGSLTLIFCLFLAVINGLLWTGFFYTRQKNSSTLLTLLAFSCIGTLTEILRSWLFTGFPWLYIGYSQTESILAGWAPVVGVYGISFILYFTGALLTNLAFQLTHKQSGQFSKQLILACLLTASCWTAGPALKTIQWTQPSGEAIGVTLVQANISQHDKWRPNFLAPTLKLYQSMSENNWHTSELIIWPEAAIPQEYHNAQPFLRAMHNKALTNGSTLLTGIPYRDAKTGAIHNSIAALGAGSGMYHKQRLVPFGEYIPLASLLEPIINIYGLPMSAMSSGQSEQEPLSISSWHTQPLICYEVVYPALSAKAARQSDILVTVSNDSWFGASIGPLQHLQMVQMRALENGRYLIRGTGNGVSAIVAADGSIVGSTEQFKQTVLQGEVYKREGYTPWTRGVYIGLPWLITSVLIALLLLRKNQTTSTNT